MADFLWRQGWALSSRWEPGSRPASSWSSSCPDTAAENLKFRKTGLVRSDTWRPPIFKCYQSELENNLNAFFWSGSELVSETNSSFRFYSRHSRLLTKPSGGPGISLQTYVRYWSANPIYTFIQGCEHGGFVGFGIFDPGSRSSSEFSPYPDKNIFTSSWRLKPLIFRLIFIAT